MEPVKRLIEHEEIDLIAAHDVSGLALWSQFKEQERQAWDRHFEQLDKIKQEYEQAKLEAVKPPMVNDES